MLLSLVYFVVRRLLRTLAPLGRSDMELEAELLVLRHQVKVLSRDAYRPPFRRRDRMLLAAASRILSRSRWKAFVVTPEDPPPVAPGARGPQVDVSPSSAWKTWD